MDSLLLIFITKLLNTKVNETHMHVGPWYLRRPMFIFHESQRYNHTYS